MDTPRAKYLDSRAVDDAFPGVGLVEPKLRQMRYARVGPPYLKIQKRVFYDRDALASWLASVTVDPAANKNP